MVTTVYAKIGADGGPNNDGVLSDWVKQLDIICQMFLVGTAVVELDNSGEQCYGKFTPNEAIEFKIDTVSLFKGYLDDPVARGRRYSVKDPEIMSVFCRDYAIDLLHNFSSFEYGQGEKIDTQIQAILDVIRGDGDTDLTYSSPDSAPSKPYNRQRVYLLEALQDLCILGDYLYYVDDAKALQLFAAASPGASGVTVKSVQGASDNNVLAFGPFSEGKGYGIKNLIDVIGPLIKGHWLEGNASDWTAIAGNALTDETTTVLAGQASIKATRVGSGIYGMELSFPKYEYTALDFSKIGHYTCYYSIYQDVGAIGAGFRMRPRLTDGSATVIEYVTVPWLLNEYLMGHTDILERDVWCDIPFPVGIDVEIRSRPGGVVPNGHWSYVSGSGFDWSDVVKIGFTSVDSFAAGQVYFDGLILPFNIKSIVDDGTSDAAYRTRKIPLTYLNVTSQLELDAYAATMLARLKDPLKDLHCIIIGDTSLRYAGQSLTVLTDNISSVTYRIQKLHHTFRDGAWREGTTKYNHITALDLIKQTI